jgi:SAM-dependent methyltransferase
VQRARTVTNTATKNFFDEWSIYDQILAHNCMHHDDIFRDVQHLLADRYATQPFSLLDLGCGSARRLAQALKGRSVSRYVGYDLSNVALAHASRNLAGLNFQTELHQGDLLDGVRTGAETFDVIFSSFALHHLSSAQKNEFFQTARERLNEGGILLLIDTMRDDGEERAVYLDRYCAWLRSRCQILAPEALDFLCEHIRNNDFPETIMDFGVMASKAGFCPPIEINRFRWHHTLCFDRANKESNATQPGGK